MNNFKVLTMSVVSPGDRFNISQVQIENKCKEIKVVGRYVLQNKVFFFILLCCKKWRRGYNPILNFEAPYFCL